MDPHEIARKLTPTLCRAMLEIDETPKDFSLTWTVRKGYRLESLGLARRTLLSDRTYATTFGLAVRRILEEQRND